jgi:hypothetical protein
VVETVVPAKASARTHGPVSVEHSKKGVGALVAWIVIPAMLLLFVLAGFFFLPGMKSLSEDEGSSPGQPPMNSSQSK